LSGKQDVDALADSVLSHLRKMFNTRQGHVLTQPEYGLPDVTHLVQNLPEMIRVSSTAIQNSIERFEPRLRHVVVRGIPIPEGDMNLWFEIRAELVTDQEEVTVSFQTRVNASGRVDIKE